MATRITPSKNDRYYINPATITFVEDSGYGVQLIQVSASSSCYILVYDPENGIRANEEGGIRRWKVTAYNNKFPDGDTTPWNIYIRLERSGTSGLVVYDKRNRAVSGGVITEVGGETVTGDADPNHYYVKIGEVGETDGYSIVRKITYDTGYLDTYEANQASGELLSRMFVPHYDDPNDPMKLSWIEAKSNMGIQGGVTMFVRGEGMDLPGIYDGIPLDGDTIYWEEVKGSDGSVIGKVLKSKGGSFEGTLGALSNVGEWADTLPESDRIMVQKKGSRQWESLELSKIGGGSADFSNVLSSGNGNAFTSFVLSEDKKTLTFVKGKTFAEKASSLAGYGITDAYTKSKVDSLLKGYITEITPAMVITALGFTPYDSSNPNGYITNSALNGYAKQSWVENQGYLTQHQDLSGYQTLITSTNKLSYALISGTPTSLKSPYSLSFGSKTYDGSAAKTITASDLGALTSHQTIYTLDFKSGKFSLGSFIANKADNTIYIPTTTNHIIEGENLYFTDERAVRALAGTLKNYVNLSEDQEIEGVKTFKNGLKGTNWVIGSDSYGNPYVKFGDDWYVKYTNDTMVVGKNNAQFVINQYGHIEVAGGATINGNMLVKGGVSFYSTNGSATPFLLDAAKIEDINSTSTTQVYTANTVRILKEELAKAEEKADACEQKLDNLKNSILAALVGINKSSSAMTIGGALNTLYNYINEE